MNPNEQSYLYLLQLADSALPIGSTAHSFGLETLVSEGYLTVPGLRDFFRDYVYEVGRVEVVYARAAYQLASAVSEADFAEAWLTLNRQLSALKLSRESREASAVLGKRFLKLVGGLEPEKAPLTWAISTAQIANVATHHAPTFGLVGGLLQINETTTLLAYLQQSVASQISACQRLLPLGQRQAAAIQWQLHSVIIDVVQQTDNSGVDSLASYNFAPLSDLSSMRHPYLTTRLFIS